MSLLPAASACASCASFRLVSCWISCPRNVRMLLYCAMHVGLDVETITGPGYRVPSSLGHPTCAEAYVTSRCNCRPPYKYYVVGAESRREHLHRVPASLPEWLRA